MTRSLRALQHYSAESCARAQALLGHLRMLNESIETVRAQRYGKLAGKIWAIVCENSELHLRRQERRDGVMVCTSCGREWPLEEVLEPASRQGHSALGISEDNLLERHEVLLIIEHACEAETLGVLTCVAIYVEKLSWRALCRYAERNWTDLSAFRWSCMRVKRLLPKGEEALARAADEAGWGLS